METTETSNGAMRYDLCEEVKAHALQATKKLFELQNIYESTFQNSIKPLIPIHHFFQDHYKGKMFFLMKYFSNGCLREVIAKKMALKQHFTEEEIVRIL